MNVSTSTPSVQGVHPHQLDITPVPSSWALSEGTTGVLPAGDRRGLPGGVLDKAAHAARPPHTPVPSESAPPLRSRVTVPSSSRGGS